MQEPRPTFRFGDLLARARQGWLKEMTRRLEARGFVDYRRSDAATLRLLDARPLAIGELGAALGITRQAARKVVDTLELRGFATTSRDAADARQRNVFLTEVGRRYAAAIVEVIEALNTELIAEVDHEDLHAADRVLRTAIRDPELRERVDRTIPPPY